MTWNCNLPGMYSESLMLRSMLGWGSRCSGVMTPVSLTSSWPVTSSKPGAWQVCRGGWGSRGSGRGSEGDHRRQWVVRFLKDNQEWKWDHKTRQERKTVCKKENKNQPKGRKMQKGKNKSGVPSLLHSLFQTQPSTGFVSMYVCTDLDMASVYAACPASAHKSPQYQDVSQACMYVCVCLGLCMCVLT